LCRTPHHTKTVWWFSTRCDNSCTNYQSKLSCIKSDSTSHEEKTSWSGRSKHQAMFNT
jgi:hypothetical protein